MTNLTIEERIEDILPLFVMTLLTPEPSELEQQVDWILADQQETVGKALLKNRILNLITSHDKEIDRQARVEAIASYRKVNKILNEEIVKELLKCRDKDGFWVDKKLLKLVKQLSSLKDSEETK